MRPALLLLLGCGHIEPFGAVPPGTDQPFDPSPPIRLTLNQGPDRDAAWLPDGSGILYSAQQLGRPDRDVCLAILPPGGGRQRQITCDLSAARANATDALETAAAAADGRLVFVAAASNIGATIPDQQAIVLGSVADPARNRTLRTIPYSLPGQRVHTGITQMHWLGPDRVVFVGEQVITARPCPGCPLDTLRTGLDATWIAVDDPAPTPQGVPGTEYASGVAAGSGPDEVYYTVGGDSRVFRQSIMGGQVAVVHDFGAAGIARDVDVVGNRMAAVVGGRVRFGTDPALGTMQWDSGGVVHVVDLTTGVAQALDGPGLFRRPRLSPSGPALVAEGYPLVITVLSDVQSDTTVSRRSDLFLFGGP